MLLRALEGFEEEWGAKNTSTLDTVNNLGNLYSKQGKLNKAKEMYGRALRGYEEAWGAKRTSTLDTVYNLGNLYKDRGEVDKANDVDERTAEGHERDQVDHEADIADLQDQFSFLLAKVAEEDDDRQPIGQQTLVSCDQWPTRAIADSNDTTNARSETEAARARQKKRNVILRIFNR